MRSTRIDTFLAGYPKSVQAIAVAARAFLEDALPSISESLDESAKLIGYSYGPGYKGFVCTLIMSQTGVKLGIFRGSELPDPNRLMTGAGKVHRHVQLRSVDDLRQPSLRRLIDDAAAAWRRRNASQM
jgi:hypothetical protein